VPAGARIKPRYVTLRYGKTNHAAIGYQCTG